MSKEYAMTKAETSCARKYSITRLKHILFKKPWDHSDINKWLNKEFKCEKIDKTVQIPNNVYSYSVLWGDI